MVIVSTTPLAGGSWTPLGAGEMLVIRRAAVVWSSGGAAAAVSGPIEVGGGAPTAGTKTSARAPAQPAGHQLCAQDGEPGVAAEVRGAPSRSFSVYHETVYAYQELVEYSRHVLRLHPASDHAQQVRSATVAVTPAPVFQRYEDVFGNQALQFELKERYTELRIIARAEVCVQPLPDLRLREERTTIPLVWMPWQRQMLLPYLLPVELPEAQLRELFEYAMSFVERQDYDLLESLLDMSQTIYRDFQYLGGATTLETTPFDVYVQRRGVCQDFANLLICLARLLGIPARYRTGYIYTGADYANKIQSEASHAWAEVYLPNVGWRGFDPTNGCMAETNHIRVAVGRNFRDATPTSGTIFRGGRGETLRVIVRVEPA
jgi:transglutaminase-like putative cysteine protease